MPAKLTVGLRRRRRNGRRCGCSLRIAVALPSIVRGAPVAGVCLALLAAGCGGGSEKAPPTGVIIAHGVERTAALKSFHFVLKVANAPSGGGLIIRFAEGDILVPDRLRARINGTIAGVALQSAIVSVGDRSFLQDPVTKQWRAFAAGANPAKLFDPAKGVLAGIRTAAALRNAGSDQVGGADTYRLAARVSADAVAPLAGVESSGRPVRLTIWVGKRDSLLRRLRLDGPVAPAEPNDIARTVELSKFDESLKITPPAAP
jgi:LppX_LprAFG lipoprotein